MDVFATLRADGYTVTEAVPVSTDADGAPIPAIYRVENDDGALSYLTEESAAVFAVTPSAG